MRKRLQVNSMHALIPFENYVFNLFCHGQAFTDPGSRVLIPFRNHALPPFRNSYVFSINAHPNPFPDLHFTLSGMYKRPQIRGMRAESSR